MLLLLIGAKTLPSVSKAETLTDWDVEGLPSNIDGVTTVQLPVDPVDAANLLLHKLENEGYPLAEVRIGKDRLIVTYGEIVEVDVEGFDENVDALIHGYLDNLIGTSPTTDQLSHAIALIDDIPGVTASVSLQRLDDLGHYKAVASGEQSRQAGVLSIRNTPTRRFEGREIAIHQEFYSAFLAGDIIRIDASAFDTNTDDEGRGIQLSHEFPIDHDGSFVETRFSHYDSTGENLFEPGQTGDAEVTSGALVIGHAFRRFVEVADYAYAEFDFRTEDNGPLGTSDYGVLRAAFAETYHSDHGTTLSWSASVSGGSELSDQDQAFALLRFGGGLIFWLPELFDTAEMRIEASGQIGSVDVPGFELFSFGGSDRQRGFAPFEYAGNHGADLTIELAETFQPWAPSSPILTPYVFTDATYIANASSVVSDSRPRHNELLSAGVGSKVSFFNGLSFNGWMAVPLYDGERPDRSHDVEFYIQGQFTW